MIGDDDEVVVTIPSGVSTSVRAEEEHSLRTKLLTQSLSEAAQGGTRRLYN
jgi:hypothetical protein